MKPKRTHHAEPGSPTGLPEPLDQVKVPPTFQFDPNAKNDAATAEPAMGTDAVTDPAKEIEPTPDAVGRLKESIPFEEERRSYSDRRKPTAAAWKGVERRSGQDRRQVRAAAAAKAAAEAAAASAGSRPAIVKKWMRWEVAKLAAGMIAVVAISSATFYKAGWETALGAFLFLTVIFFMGLFYHLNQKK